MVEVRIVFDHNCQFMIVRGQRGISHRPFWRPSPARSVSCAVASWCGRLCSVERQAAQCLASNVVPNDTAGHGDETATVEPVPHHVLPSNREFSHLPRSSSASTDIQLPLCERFVHEVREACAANAASHARSFGAPKERSVSRDSVGDAFASVGSSDPLGDAAMMTNGAFSGAKAVLENNEVWLHVPLKLRNSSLTLPLVSRAVARFYARAVTVGTHVLPLQTQQTVLPQFYKQHLHLTTDSTPVDILVCASADVIDERIAVVRVIAYLGVTRDAPEVMHTAAAIRITNRPANPNIIVPEPSDQR